MPFGLLENSKWRTYYDD